ncbi:serine hydrolase [Defluviimonas sp. D31]|uniref:D-alanyl-D-alanine carboxypeptidase family protein n=1 Tax=Defluviimonas sp. D31 TaxID=3083253 RepID=UPI00296ED57E|nr:serine hydrolase [Defluviimonas sp. D31]MDW4551353.1 serine hydrolase [Defluviimonas sp. D31]
MVPILAQAAPYADFVIDARTGQVLHEDNADTRLHPASLTKMMTLYVAFEAIERGEISLDSKVKISKHAASQPPSRLGLRAGQTIALRYLIRAAAIKSANDAATAIGEAIEGSEPAFAKRMNRTAKSMGMSRTTFVNANGLTAKGHLSTARDMTTLGRHLFYDFPQYYNIFSRTTADAGVAQVAHTNRRFLAAYKGADGIKTGYTSAAGFNLTASAQRGDKRIITTVFGGKSTASRNARVAELMDLGFGKAPNRVAVQKPARPVYVAGGGAGADVPADDVTRVVAEAISGSRTLPAGKTLRLNVAVAQSPRPLPRPVPGDSAPADELLVAMQDTINAVLAEAQGEPAPEAPAATVIAAAETEAAPAEAAEPATAPAGPTFVQETAPQPETVLAAAAPAPEVSAKETESVVAASMTLPETTPAPRPAELVAEAATPVEPEAVEPTEAVDLAEAAPAAEPAPEPAETVIVAAPAPAATAPEAPEQIVLAAVTQPEESAEDLEVVTRVSTSGGRQWSINVGHYSSRYNAERQLLQTALVEMTTLDDALRKVVSRNGGFDANFVGMTEEMAQLACRRLQARQTDCTVVGP